MTRVLLIEDDPAVRKGVHLALRRRGHEVETAASGETGLLALDRFRPELVLLDLMLPGMSGLEVCRRIRETQQIPIIILSARGDDIDMVVGLEAGADDYVVKPAGGEVLQARMRAVLRRVAGEPGGGAAAGAPGAAASPSRPSATTYGALTIDRAALLVTKNGHPLVLAPSELKLLLFLSDAPGQVFSRQQLLEQVWEHSFYGDVRLVDACVMRLRARIEDDSRAPTYVQTVRGFGYRFGPL
ncbi:DNA-binding response regulator [Streptomyces chrestomyceticus JCM 4735]|uniref:DNA-binding response regulator n=1 Tax=Streptomyces chrestomyceticus JCM 4735 TaxID=1306181 RepID=A0A7U9L276_9ACTN|nr:response regulator transcription factor [Streptomyces chrestomyceticus]GCD38226.1 DNA-binding response regulator [Streptomyces chrestomyceticus JCM 4735]